MLRLENIGYLTQGLILRLLKECMSFDNYRQLDLCINNKTLDLLKKYLFVWGIDLLNNTISGKRKYYFTIPYLHREYKLIVSFNDQLSDGELLILNREADDSLKIIAHFSEITLEE